MASMNTKQCRLNLWVCRIIDLLILILPLIIYFFIGICNDGIVVPRKVGLVGMFAVALLLTLFNIIWQKHLRCPIWICVIGFYIAMKNYILPLVIILAITSLVDEIVLTPMIKYYKTKLIANKAIDERFDE